MIVIDEALLQEFRDKRRCERCKRWVLAGEPHHHQRRGMGGGTRLDIRENLIALCADCHRLAQDYKVPASEVLALIASREGLTPEECQQRIWDTLAKEKPC